MRAAAALLVGSFITLYDGFNPQPCQYSSSAARVSQMPAVTQNSLLYCRSCADLIRLLSFNCILNRHIFGLGSGTADNLHWLDEQTAIYSAGQNVVLYSPDTKTQTFLSGAQDSEGICAMCISPNRKFLAVGEKALKATVTIYDMSTMKRRKVLVSTIAGGKVGSEFKLLIMDYFYISCSSLVSCDAHEWLSSGIILRVC